MNRVGLKSAGFVMLLMLVFGSAMAQSGSKYSFGIIVDPQITWLKSDNEKKISGDGSIVNMNIGFMGSKFFADRYAIEMGVSLSSIGGNLLHKDSSQINTVNGIYGLNENAKVKYRGQYVTVPIGFKFRSIEIGYISFYASLGVKANILLKGYSWADAESIVSYSDGAIPSEGIEKERTEDTYNFLYASYYLGAGIEYSLGGESSIQLGLTYTGGLSSVIDTKVVNPDFNASIQGHAMSLRLGFIF